MDKKPITFGTFILEPQKTKTITILQPGKIPPRPKWMIGEPGYSEQVFPICPYCGSLDVWRGPWCNKPEFGIRTVRMEPLVKHSGRGRHGACLSCKAFWGEWQAIPYTLQDEDDDT